ncbi:hypothetical protein [Infirmifilum sp. SLHALR2]|nr:MAG: hypothetical protein B7L53_01650 [Thermofilum sp. NZ13]
MINTLKVLNVKAQAVSVDRGDVLTLIREGSNVLLARVRPPRFDVKYLYRFNGVRGVLIARLGDIYLASVDSTLYASRDLVEWRSALTVARGNSIWHACEFPEGIVVQEYGESPTGLYASADGYRWSRVLTNIEADPTSRHFHYIAYDPYRDAVHATLGDANLVRAVAIKGGFLEPAYRGPWQFLPVAVLEDIVVFGFDSGIARGGLGVFSPEEEKWSFIFLKWRGGGVRHAQMNELKAFKGVWIGALGASSALAVSDRLGEWRLLHLEGLNQVFNNFMSLAVGENFTVASTGEKLIVFNESDVSEALRGSPSWCGTKDKK